MNKYIRNVAAEEYKKEHTPEKEVENTFSNIIEQKKTKKFIFNRWTLIYITVGVAAFLLVNTILVVSVNSSLHEVQILQKELSDIRQKNEILKREINYLESPERISQIANEKLGLIQSKDAPQFLENTDKSDKDKSDE